MGDRTGLVHLRIGFQKVPSSATYVADKEFAENHLVPHYLVSAKKVVKAAGKWLTASQESNPNRSID